MALPIGAEAPNFTLPSTSGGTFTLHEEFRGKIGILYFYPKDFSGGCTMEACSFRDSFAEFRGLDVPVVGISADDVATHQRFRDSLNLPFHLLADTEKIAASAYDVLAPFVSFVQRVTFLIDENMRIAAVYQNLFDFSGHIKQMLAELRKNSLEV